MVEFDLALSNTTTNTTVVTVDVARNHGRETLARREVNGTTTLPATVEFNLTKPTLVEPRVFFHGQGDVTLRGIHLRDRPPSL